MTLLSWAREVNRKLNDRYFPRSHTRYVTKFREDIAALSGNARLVLHLGSGTKDLKPFVARPTKGVRVLNLDISYQELRQNPGQLKLCACAESLPLHSNSVDLICAEHSFEHFPCPERVLEECLRVLVQDGYLLISGPNGRSYIALVARLTPQWFHDLVRRLAGGTSNPGFPTFYRFSTPRAMRRLGEDAGFEIVSLETFVGEPCYTTFLPLVHILFMLYHKVLETVKAVLNFHVTHVALFRKPRNGGPLGGSG